MQENLIMILVDVLLLKGQVFSGSVSGPAEKPGSESATLLATESINSQHVTQG